MQQGWTCSPEISVLSVCIFMAVGKGESSLAYRFDKQERGVTCQKKKLRLKMLLKRHPSHL